MELDFEIGDLDDLAAAEAEFVLSGAERGNRLAFWVSLLDRPDVVERVEKGARWWHWKAATYREASKPTRRLGLSPK